MGFLHAGHLSLIDQGKRVNPDGKTIVSIFVNPLQFGPNEDFSQYPRDETRDLKLLQEKGVDAVFLPTVSDLYPKGHDTSVLVRGPSLQLEGALRPDHFVGVATVVSILLHLFSPKVAVFGQKDAQQVAVVQKLIKDLWLPTKMVVAPTVREKDGLALSSRNIYLSPQERSQASGLYKALRAGISFAENNPHATATLIEQVVERTAPELAWQYVSLRSQETFAQLTQVDSPYYLLGSVKFERVRLLDNVIG